MIRQNIRSRSSHSSRSNPPVVGGLLNRSPDFLTPVFVSFMSQM
jgi:hypothetical protein